MGIVGWFRQLVGRESSEQEDLPQAVQEEVSSVISIDQNGITLISNALESIASLKRAVEGGMDFNDAKLQLAARGKIASIRAGLRKMLDTKRASRDRSEMRAITKDFATLYGEFSALTYYHETFASDFAELRNTLRELDTLFYPRESAPKSDGRADEAPGSER